MQKKKNGHFWQEQLAQVCSQIVYFFFLCFFKFLHFFAEKHKKKGFQQKEKHKKNQKT